MFFMPGLSLEDTEDTETVVVARELWRSYYDDGGGWWLCCGGILGMNVAMVNLPYQLPGST